MYVLLFTQKNTYVSMFLITIKTNQIKINLIWLFLDTIKEHLNLQIQGLVLDVLKLCKKTELKMYITLQVQTQ